MIDPRNMPCARVCLSRLSPMELPPNALEQYHNFTTKRKSSMTSHNEVKDVTGAGMSSQSPIDFSCVPGMSDHGHASAASLNVAKDTCGTDMSSQHLPDKNPNGTGTSASNYLFMPIESDRVDTKPVNVTINTLSTSRRNSVVSSSSRHSSGSSNSKLNASVCLTPITWERPVYTPRRYMPATEQLYYSEIMSDITDGSTLSGTDSCSYFMRNDLKPQGFSYREMSVTSSLSATNDSEQDMDEKTYPSDFTSFDDHIMYGSEDVWPDLRSYSPPESPVTQNTETTATKEFEKTFPKEPSVFNMEGPNARTQPAKDEKPGELLNSIRSTEQNIILSPDMKLVPFNKKDDKHNERRTSPTNDKECKRKSSSPTGNLVVKVEDVGEKLKPRVDGGLTVVTNSTRERYTSSGRRIANTNYNEKSLAKSSMTRALAVLAKQSKIGKSKTSKGRRHGGGTGLAGDLEHPSRKQGKKRKRRPAEEKRNPLWHYENLKFSELNTVPRMSVRYNVAFRKWPYVFSGALDLINQRLGNQNAFWDSIRS